jgi:hypothetical protein
MSRRVDPVNRERQITAPKAGDDMESVGLDAFLPP